MAKATALLAQERREKTLRALEYIQRHQYLYQEGQMAALQKHVRGTIAAKSKHNNTTPGKAERSCRKLAQAARNAYAQPEYVAGAFDSYY